MKNETITFEREFGYIKIKGKYYEPEEKDGKISFKEIENAKGRIKKGKEMAKILEYALDKEAVLTESIMKLENKDFDMLYKSLKSGRKYKAKTREHHCVDMKIGNFVLPIVN